MSLRTRSRRREGVSRLVAIIVVVWLIIGAIAAGQRGYYSSAKTNCASFATVAGTVLAGPLNYLGVNPKIHCTVPQPSK
jgi:membrane protein YdbS with pleckstrin-like domain